MSLEMPGLQPTSQPQTTTTPTTPSASPDTAAAPKSDPSAPKATVPSGSAGDAAQRLQQLLYSADTTIAKYAEYAGVTLRPAHGPIGRSINANAVYGKLVENGMYDPTVAAEAKNFLEDMAGIGEQANMNFNLRGTSPDADPKGVPLNQGNTKFDPELVKLVKEMYRNDLATQRGKSNGDKEPVWGKGDSSPRGAATAPQTASKPANQNADLPKLTPDSKPPQNEPLW